MNWLMRALTSSIGQKVLMALTGLALCGFLVMHLGGNLLLYIGAEQYNHYAHQLHAQVALLLVAEVGLFLLFAGHIYLALTVTRLNQSARPQPYAMRQSKIGPSPFVQPASYAMGITGLIVLAFLIVHLADFRFELHNAGSKGEEPFAKAKRLLVDPLTFITYVIGSIALGYHVLHGFQSAFQTLGLNHPKYMPALKALSIVFAVVVGAGFVSFPLWALMTRSH